MDDNKKEAYNILNNVEFKLFLIQEKCKLAEKLIEAGDEYIMKKYRVDGMKQVEDLKNFLNRFNKEFRIDNLRAEILNRWRMKCPYNNRLLQQVVQNKYTYDTSNNNNTETETILRETYILEDCVKEKCGAYRKPFLFFRGKCNYRG